MASVGSIQIDFTANIKKLLTATERVDKRLERLQKSATKAKKNLANFAKAAVGVYAVSKAFDAVIISSLRFNKQMEDAETKLRAMIDSASSFETQSGRIVNAQERQALVTQETTYTMGLLKKINAETAFGMSDLISSYALMKPAMDRANVSTEDQIKLLKLVSNTATAFGLSNQELSTGIDDLAAGTYRTTQSFGKMMKAIGVSREEIKTTTDLVGYLSQKMEATGKAQDTMTVAMSNFGVSFDTLRGTLTQGIFDQLKRDLKILTKQMDTTSPQAMQVFADSITDMANIGINAIAALTLSITGLVSLMQTVYGGYQKLAGLIGGGISSSALEQRKKDLKELQRIQKEKDYGWFSNQNDHIVSLAINKQKKAIEEIIADQKYWNDLRAKGDKQVEATAQKQAALTDTTLKTAQTLHLEYKKLTEEASKGQIKPKDQLKRIINNDKKRVKSAKNSNKKIIQDAKRAAKEYNDIISNIGQNFGDTLANAISPVASELYRFYQTVDTLMTAASAKSQAQSAADGAAATGPAIAKAGSQAGLYGAIAMAALLATIGIAGSGSFNTELSQSQIDAAAGNQNFDTHALSDIRDILESNQAPQLTATRAMLQHLESMDGNFGALANALSSTVGFDFGGANYQETSASNWWGGLTKILLGSGLKFGKQTVDAFLKGVDVAGYQAEKVIKTSFFGLVSKEHINEINVKVPDKLKKNISKALSSSIQTVLDAADILGFDTKAIKSKIDKFVLDLGKINFKDLNAEEKAQALKDAFSGQLNSAFQGAIDSVASPENIAALKEMAKAGEEYTTTLIRAAVQHEYISTQLKLFGQSVTDFATSDSLVQAAGGLDKFKTAMDIFTSRFFSGKEQQAMLKTQLDMALAVYDKAIPASKAQFKALLLETQQKIINIKASISAMKAEVAAKVASGEIGIKAAYGELAAKSSMASALGDVIKVQIRANNSLISSSHEAGKASVGFGKSIHNAIQAMAGAVTAAVTDGTITATDNIDYSQITSPAIAAAETELKNLEGLYGTLMDNVGQFADYYDGVQSAVNDAADAMSNLEKQLLAIANFKATLTNNNVESAKIKLDATTRETGLTALTTSNILSELNKNMSKISDANSTLLQDYQDQYSALKAYESALKDQKRGFEDIKNIWGGSSNIEKARTALARVVEDTHLAGVNFDNFLQKMNEGVVNGDGVAKWKQLSDALQNVYKIEQDRSKALAKDYNDLQTTSLKTLLEFGTKTAKASISTLNDALKTGDFKEATTAFNDYAKAVKTDNSKTYKQKTFDLARANNLITNIEKQNPNSELVKGLELIRKENEMLRKELKATNNKLDAIERNTHGTKNNTNNEYLKVVGEA